MMDANPMSAHDEASARGRVLVIDDDEQIRRLIVRLLRPLGIALEEAASAEEGFEKLRGAPPDLVLLDMQLPGRSGHEVLAEIRSDPRTRLVPVVMITGAGTHELKLKAIEAGVTDFIAKPFS